MIGKSRGHPFIDTYTCGGGSPLLYINRSEVSSNCHVDPIIRQKTANARRAVRSICSGLTVFYFEGLPVKSKRMGKSLCKCAAIDVRIFRQPGTHKRRPCCVIVPGYEHIDGMHTYLQTRYSVAIEPGAEFGFRCSPHVVLESPFASYSDRLSAVGLTKCARAACL